MPNCAKIARHLTKLLHKGQEFIWDEKTEQAFNELKDRLCNPPVLAFPDFAQPFIITTDASNYGISAILSQGKIGEDIPIAYASRMLRAAEKNYSTYEKEALAVIFGVKHFKQYVYNMKFTIITDHRPLIYFKTADCNARVLRWRFYLTDLPTRNFIP